MAEKSIYSRLINYESELNAKLIESNGNPASNYYDNWLQEVIRIAKYVGKIDISQEEIDKGINLVERPIFICGIARSGTTYARDLFDGHPEICSLPGEANLLTSLLPRLRKTKHHEETTFYLEMWMRGFLTSCINNPFLSLGKSELTHSPYVEFVRYFLSWWEVTKRIYPKLTMQPLMTLALALASHLNGGEIPGRYKYWLEKTLMNELFIDEIRAELPYAIFLIMVRHPEKVYHSRKEMDIRRFGKFISRWSALRNMQKSHRSIAKYARTNDMPLQRLIRYEDLIEDKIGVLKKLCSFLKIEYDEKLNEQTVLGHQAYSNTSFKGEMPLTKVTLSEKKMISALLANNSEILGDEFISMPIFERVYFIAKYYGDYFVSRVFGLIKRMVSWVKA